MHFDRISFTCSCEGEKSRNDFKFGIFIGRFPSDGAANMAVEGLIDFLVHASLFGKEER